jgi:hypothetical protein
MTLSITSDLNLSGNFVNGTGATISGSGRLRFVGRTACTLASAGTTFGPAITCSTFGGSLTLQGAFTTSSSSGPVLEITTGTFSDNGYNVTLGSTANIAGVLLSGGTVSINAPWTIALKTNFWQATGGTVVGNGIISSTGMGPSTKSFLGGGINTYPTLNHGGSTPLTIFGYNTFANITNSYALVGNTTVRFEGGTTNTFAAFNLTGTVGKTCALAASTPATLKKPSEWLMGANSTNGGNNTGLTFAAGGGIDYLSVSYINGIQAATAGGSFLMMFM